MNTISDDLSNSKTKNDNVSKDQRIYDFILTMKTVEDTILPFKEQLKEMKTEYVENGWLTKDEIKNAIRAWRLLKSDVDMDNLKATFDTLVEKSGRGNEV